ncbi:MAG: hypothetical protein U1E78_03170 [Gammaproteobacteria bacterium]
MRELSVQEQVAAHGGANIISDTLSAVFSDGLTNSEIGLLAFGAIGGFSAGIVVGNSTVVSVVSVAALLGGGFLAYQWYFDKDDAAASPN